MSGFLRSVFSRKQVVEDIESDVREEKPVGGQPLHVGDDSFVDLVLGSSTPALVDFWAPWCGPCRMIAPIVEQLASKYAGRVLVAKVNTDEHVETATKLGIQGIPTLVIFDNGQEVDRVVGFAPSHALEERLDRVLE
jgi:thioredoxin 1